MTFRAGSDLVTLLRTLDMSNVAALTDRPVIRLLGIDDADGDEESGELILSKEIYRPIPLTKVLRHQKVVIPATYVYSGTSETTVKEVIEEFDRVLRVESRSPSKTYIYSMDFDWDTNINESVIILTFTLIKLYVVT